MSTSWSSDRRRRRHRQAVVEAALAHSKHVVTANKALLAEHGTASPRRPRRPASRSPSRRRWPAASRSSRRCARGWPPTGSAHLRHPQRHLQLHPDDDARDRPRVRRRAGRGAEARLCRGRPELRRRRHRRRAQAGDPGQRRVRLRGRFRRRSCRGHPPHLARSTSPMPRSSATASSSWASRARPSTASSSASIPAWCQRHADRPGRGRVQRGGDGGRFRRPERARGTRAGAGPTASAVVADLIDIAAGRSVPTFGVPATPLKPLPPRRWRAIAAPITCG